MSVTPRHAGGAGDSRGAEASQGAGTGPQRERVRFHLDFLDGLRGLSALYVVFFHAYQATASYGPLPPALADTISWSRAGEAAVCVFIVLSGYSLMLPVVRDGGALRGGLMGFALRRGRRILPPYYGVILLSVLTLPLTRIFVDDPRLYIHGEWPILDAKVLVSHLLLVHNLKTEWRYKIAGPLWSVATEWQIYIVFALVLLPLWRRTGPWVTLLAAFALGVLPRVHHPGIAGATPWLLGLFALGMTAAQITVRPRTAPRIPWGLAAGAGAAVLVGVNAFLVRHPYDQDPLWKGRIPLDVWVGLCASALILYCAQPANAGSPVRRFLEWRPCRALGAFSYSLYLIHSPVIACADAWLHLRHVTGLVHILALDCLAVPVALALAYLFHLVFERPFMPGRPRTERQAEIAAAVSPAP